MFLDMHVVCSSSKFYLIHSIIIDDEDNTTKKKQIEIMYEDRSESKERFAIQTYLFIIGKKQNMQVLSHTFTYFST